jgi:hypothetical protein
MTVANTQPVAFTSTWLNMTNKGAANKQQPNFSVLAVSPVAGGDAVKRKSLILPPGDYYIEQFDLDSTASYEQNVELVIDNAGLSVGGNPNRIPVRIWMNWTQNNPSTSNITIPVSLTDPSDPSTFRLFYGEDNGAFQFSRPSSWPSGTVYEVAGAVYAVSGGTSGTTISFVGGSNASLLLQLRGALMADMVNIKGYSSIIYSQNVVNPQDPGAGANFNNSYSDGSGG